MAERQKRIKTAKHLLRALLALALLGALAALGGCSGKVAKKSITMEITPEPSLNNGQPVCIVIRQVNKKNFLVEGYDEIADMVYSDPPDGSLLAWKMLLPGQKEELRFEMPEKGDVGIYCLSTDPGDHWKTMIDNPRGSKYKVALGENSLETSKSGFSLWPF